MLANGVLWRPRVGPAGRVMMLLAADLVDAIRRRLVDVRAAREGRRSEKRSDRYSLLGLAGAGDAERAHATRSECAVAPLAAVPFSGDANALALPDGRIVVACPPPSAPDHPRGAGAARRARPTPRSWRWFGIAAGVPMITAATSDLFVPQAANWDVLGGVNFQKGCYPGQEIVARMQYLGRLKERLFAFRTEAEDVAPAARCYSRRLRRPGVRHGRQCGAATRPAAACCSQSSSGRRSRQRTFASTHPTARCWSQSLPYRVPDGARAARAADGVGGGARRCASPSSRSTRIPRYALVVAANRDEFHARAGGARALVERR